MNNQSAVFEKGSKRKFTRLTEILKAIEDDVNKWHKKKELSSEEKKEYHGLIEEESLYAKKPVYDPLTEILYNKN